MVSGASKISILSDSLAYATGSMGVESLRDATLSMAIVRGGCPGTQFAGTIE